MQSLNSEEINQVSGGNLLLDLLEIPHIIMGLIEFFNFTIDRSINGCGNIDEGDHLTKSACRLLGYHNE